MPSAIARKAVYQSCTDKVFLFFIEIDSVDLADPLRFVGSRETINVNGNDYIGYPFLISTPGDDGETISTIEIIIDNVSRELVEVVRSISNEITITFWISLYDTPETIEEGPFTMGLVDIKMNALNIKGTLTDDPIMSQPVCDYTVTPVTFPGLYKGTATS